MSALQRVLRSLLVILAVTFFVRLLLSFTPGSVAQVILGENATPDSVAALDAELGLDRSVFVQYWDWVNGAVTGDLGQSPLTNQVVITAIFERLPVTLELALLGLLIALVVSIPLAIVSASRPGSWIDRTVTAFSSMMLSIPAFVAAPVLLYIFSLQLGWFPVTGWNKLSEGVGPNLNSALLPSISMALPVIASFHRILRTDLIGTLNEDFVAAARAKGLPGWFVMARHVMRPSSFSLITVAGINLGHLIGGTVIVESLFALPGLGQLIATSIMSRDVIMVQGIVVFIAVVYVAVNTAVDLSYSRLDPRIRKVAAKV